MKSKGLSDRSVNKYFQYANHIIDFSVWAFHFHENPWKKRIPLKPTKFHIELLTVDEYALIYHNSQEHLKWALEVEYYTGMRSGATELFAALWEHVDWNNSRIRIYASKTDDWRWQYLPAHFMDRMRHQYANRTCEYIVTYHGKPVTSQLTKL